VPLGSRDPTASASSNRVDVNQANAVVGLFHGRVHPSGHLPGPPPFALPRSALVLQWRRVSCQVRLFLGQGNPWIRSCLDHSFPFRRSNLDLPLNRRFAIVDGPLGLSDGIFQGGESNINGVQLGPQVISFVPGLLSCRFRGGPTFGQPAIVLVQDPAPRNEKDNALAHQFRALLESLFRVEGCNAADTVARAPNGESTRHVVGGLSEIHQGTLAEFVAREFVLDAFAEGFAQRFNDEAR
jgi:hypothetical protein